LRQVDDRRQADWLVRFDAGQVLLVPGSGWPSAAGRAGPPSFVPGGKWTDPAEGVRASLENVARAVNLVRLASQDPASVQSQFGECLDVGMTIVVLADKYDPHGKPLAWQKQGLLVPSGTLVRLTLENRERCEVDVTLLYVDSQFGISPIFPVNGQFNRLLANERHSLAPGKIVSDRGGLEHFVLLAAPAQPQIPPVDFSFLEQPSLQEASQGAGARGGLREMRGGGSSLERLLETAIDGREQTRAPKPRKPKEYSMRVISIQVASKTP
jgi:hypothetical protein